MEIGVTLATTIERIVGVAWLGTSDVICDTLTSVYCSLDDAFTTILANYTGQKGLNNFCIREAINRFVKSKGLM